MIGMRLTDWLSQTKAQMDGGFMRISTVSKVIMEMLLIGIGWQENLFALLGWQKNGKGLSRRCWLTSSADKPLLKSTTSP